LAKLTINAFDPTKSAIVGIGRKVYTTLITTLLLPWAFNATTPTIVLVEKKIFNQPTNTLTTSELPWWKQI
jgi:hypothetical protein